MKSEPPLPCPTAQLNQSIPGQETNQSLSTLTLNPESVRETYHLGLKTWSRERNIFIPESKTKTHYLTLKLVSKKHKLPLESEPDKEICPGPKIRDTSLTAWGARPTERGRQLYDWGRLWGDWQ